MLINPSSPHIILRPLLSKSSQLNLKHFPISQSTSPHRHLTSQTRHHQSQRPLASGHGSPLSPPTTSTYQRRPRKQIRSPIESQSTAIKTISLDKGIVDRQGRVIEPNLLALLTLIRRPPPVSDSQPFRPILDDPEAPSLSQSDYQSIRTNHPTLLSSLPQTSFNVFIDHTLKSRCDSFSSCMIEDLLDSTSNTFSHAQRIFGLQKLINLARRRRRWVPETDKRLSFVSDEAVSKYFAELVRIMPVDQQGRLGSFGLSAENLRCVIKALRRSNHPLFWDTKLMSRLWARMTEARSNDNRLETHARFGIRSILKWISCPSPPGTPIQSHPEGSSRPADLHDTQHTLSLCLKIYSQLVEWNYVRPEDIYRTSLDDDTLLPHYHAIITILGSIINTSIRRYTAEPLGRDNAKLFKDSFEALETIWDLLDVNDHESTSYMLEKFASRLIRTFNEAAKTDQRSPAPLVVNILLRFADLPTVKDRRTDEQSLSPDDLLCKNTLDTLFRLGRSTLLVHTWLALIPSLNLAKLDWALLRLLTGLEELANPLVRGERGKPLSPFRLVRIVLSLMDALAEETDKRMRPSRRKAFRLIMEHPRTQAFDWLSTPPRRFDQHGIELASEKDTSPESLQASNLQALIRLWKSSWLGRAEEQGNTSDPIPLPTLRSITRLAEAIPGEQTNETLKEAITTFVTHRTPVAIKSSTDQSKYLEILPANLNHEELSTLISAHLIIGTELSQKFNIDLFNLMLLNQMVPSKEDIKNLLKLLQQLIGQDETN
ncbi:hypothetical protein CROQUDRAFT_131501 [Cronartium quercuum f. sp. fusiforme G11]|uniref:Uncharacterized protein n=1 Tax=Cronartium quercuum f. sp. fusiforme G11 TaxID=708437 RepID=A0A9P6TFY0_9BASI|nr:hypothetical protein CROQUDRAFT_131501 [Cronartium quercuum f. sp. fusiforme G11]